MNVRFLQCFSVFFSTILFSRCHTLSILWGSAHLLRMITTDAAPPPASVLKRKNLESIIKWEPEIATEPSCAGFVKLLQCDNQRTLALSPTPSMTVRPIVPRESRKRCRRQMQSSKLCTYTQSSWPRELLAQLQNPTSAVLLNIAVESQQHSASQILRDVPAWML